MDEKPRFWAKRVPPAVRGVHAFKPERTVMAFMKNTPYRLTREEAKTLRDHLSKAIDEDERTDEESKKPTKSEP